MGKPTQRALLSETNFTHGQAVPQKFRPRSGGYCNVDATFRFIQVKAKEAMKRDWACEADRATSDKR